jgi:hypothetical protein
MKNTSLLAFCLLLFLISAPAGALEIKKVKRSERKNLNLGPQGAVGVLDVYLFRNKNVSQRCTATHIGNGLMITSGHCFMGAYECNAAKVSWENENFTSRCQYILYSNASESYASGSEISNDLTVFKVDKYPSAAVALSSGSRPTESVLSTEAVALSKRRTGESMITVTSTPCKLIIGPLVNIFSQPKPSDTASHNCELGNIASGSPLMKASGDELIAIHQGTSLLPDPESTAATAEAQKVNYAKVFSSADLQKIINLPYALPDNIRIGGFAGEVFSTGVSEPWSFTVAYLQAKAGSSTISFGVHNGLDTLIEATDGDGKKMLFGGPRRAGYDQRFRMKAPVKITITSTQGGIAPLAWLENIQSP